MRRRRFLRTCGQAGLAWAAGARSATLRAEHPFPLPSLPQRFSDLRRHFVFEYYPWYGGPPRYEHWNQWGRVPPLDLGSHYLPRLGAYDSRSAAVIEQHARWIHEAGAGAIALSWWGRGSYEDRSVGLILDVMKAHDIKVTFGLEPYADDRGQRYAEDVLYLLREFGERRRFDAFLLLRDEAGREAPVFKGFRLILLETLTDCHNVTRPVADFTPDGVWRRETDAVRHALRGEFPHVTLLADSLEFVRTPACGFDGVSIYDNFIPPEDYAGYAAAASRAGLAFSFNVNPGFDSIEPRTLPARSCHLPQRFDPPTPALDWSRPEDRERAALRSAERIESSWRATVREQTDPGLANVRKGFFLVFINSFNEWHEGHAFEPMKDAADLTPGERALPYHNPANGAYRLETLGRLLRAAQQPVEGPS